VTAGYGNQSGSSRWLEMPIADGSDSATLLDRVASLRQTNVHVAENLRAALEAWS
jgi:hypothetical protein